MPPPPSRSREVRRKRSESPAPRESRAASVATPMDSEPTGRKLRSATVSTHTSSDSSPFPAVDGVPFHKLEDSAKRGKKFGANPIKGDRRVVEDEQRSFAPVVLPPDSDAGKHFLGLFEEADKVRSRKGQTSYGAVQRRTSVDGSTAVEAFGIVEPMKGVLTGRLYGTPPAQGMVDGVDDPSHAIPVSAVSNPLVVNKREFMLAENRASNQGGARVMEELGRDRALSSSGSVALVTRYEAPPDSPRPKHVSRLLIERSPSDTLTVFGASSHNNDKTPPE